MIDPARIERPMPMIDSAVVRARQHILVGGNTR